MQYKVITFTFFFLFFVVVAVRAQSSPNTTIPVVIVPPSEQIGEWQPLDLSPAFPPHTVNTAANECSAAPTLPLPGGDGSNVNGMTESSNDPILSCMWGSPSNYQGYRTVWYKFVAPHNGMAAIETLGSNYDTVLGIYTGSCETNLIQLACSDDVQGFTSKAEFEVIKGITYYIEVADWQFSPPSPANLSVTALLNPVDSRWQQIGNLPVALSRHATAVVGGSIFILGGQETMGTSPVLSNNTYRYNTVSGIWDEMAEMPGAGYSNTAAAYIDGPNDDGRIYLPSGYSGNNTAFDITHWVYDVPGNYWFNATSATSVSGVLPFAWATATAVPSQGGYFVAGGLLTQPPFVPDAQVSNQMLFYAVTNNTWFRRADMITARYAHTAARLGNYVCVVGGVGTGNVLIPDGECYEVTGSSGWFNIPVMNYPRYNAGSAVGPDGRWYVFGGTDASGNAVSVTEVYDLDSNRWTALNVTYDLGASATEPARTWPRGGFVGDNLWVFGGNTSPGNQILSLFNKLYTPSRSVLLPAIFSPPDTFLDDNFGVAKPLAIHVPGYGNFDELLDFYDAYFFYLPNPGTITISLTQIPVGSDYNFRLYNNNKLLWGSAENLGNLDEWLTVTVGSGYYFIMVERVFPYGDPDPAVYQILIQQ